MNVTSKKCKDCYFKVGKKCEHKGNIDQFGNYRSATSNRNSIVITGNNGFVASSQTDKCGSDAKFFQSKEGEK